MKVILFFALLLGFSACCKIHNKIEYSFEGTTIVRTDKSGRSTFVYTDSMNQNRGTIWVEYSGLVSGFSGYLEFEKNGKVYLLSGDGNFKSKNLDTTKFDFKRIYAFSRPSIGENVCWILNATNVEQERNVRDSTGVRIKYSANQLP